MKLRNFMTCLLLAALPLAFSACSDDDDDNGGSGSSAPEWAGIAGTYTGYTSADVMYSSEPIIFEDEKLIVTVAGDGTTSLELVSQGWNTTVEDAGVVSVSGGWQITGEASCVITSPYHETSTDVTYQGNVTAVISADKSSAEMTLFLPGVMGGTTVTFHTGSAPE